MIFARLSLVRNQTAVSEITVRSSIFDLHALGGGDRSNDFKQQQNDDDQNDQANTTATVVTNSRPQTIATKPEDEKQDNKNDQHTFSFAELLRVNQQQ